MTWLAKRDEAARCRAVESLVGRSDEDALERLIEATRDDSWRVRERAVKLLVHFKSERLANCIRDTIVGHRDPSVRNAVIDALMRQGEVALPALCQLAAEQHWELRLHAAVMLGKIASPAGVETLARLLQDAEENVVHAAAESLGAIGHPSAVPPLVAILQTRDFWSQYPAVIALGRIGHHSATPLLLDFLSDEMLAPAVVDALGKIADPRALQPLLKMLHYEGEEPLVPLPQLLRAIVRVVDAASAAAELPPWLRESARHAVVEALASADAEDRMAALFFAGWVRDPALIPLIASRLAIDADQDAAYSALRRMGAEAVSDVMPLLDADAPPVRRLAIRLLADVGADLHPILRHIIDPDETVRMEVALAIGRTARADLSEYLLEMLLDENRDVRRVALEVLANFGADSAVREQLYRRLEYYPDDHLPVIIETLGRLNVADALDRLRPLSVPPHTPEVRAAAVRAIRQIGGPAALEPLLAAACDPDPSVRTEALTALPRHAGEIAYATLVAALNDTDSQVLYTAVTALGELGDGRAVPRLVSLAKDEGQDMGLRVAAIRALGHLQSKETATVLNDLLGTVDADARREVVRALGLFAGNEALQGLIRASADPVWSVRAAAIKALAQRGPDARTCVLQALNDPDSLVRKVAVRGLSGGEPAIILRLLPLLADDEVEDVVAQTLESYGVSVVPYLADVTEQPNPTLRLRVARLLNRIGGTAARRLLERLAADPVSEVATVAARALAQGDTA